MVRGHLFINMNCNSIVLLFKLRYRCTPNRNIHKIRLKINSISYTHTHTFVRSRNGVMTNAIQMFQSVYQNREIPHIPMNTCIFTGFNNKNQSKLYAHTKELIAFAIHSRNIHRWNNMLGMCIAFTTFNHSKHIIRVDGSINAHK